MTLKEAPDKQCCEEYKCRWHGTSEQVLKAPHPFNEDAELWFCPDCLEPNSIVVACDEPGCWQISTCGTPTKEGYRRTCGKHAPPINTK